MRYQSIYRWDNQSALKYCEENGLLDGPCFATEKVHGMNYSFLYNKEDKSVTHQSRDTILPFGVYNSPVILHEIVTKVILLGEFLNCNFQLVGEFFGGAIVESKTKIKYFTDDSVKAWHAFDLYLTDEGVFDDQDAFYHLMHKFGIPTTPVLVRSTFKELIKMNPAIQSKVGDNEGVEAEGIVIKFNTDRFTLGEERSRVVFKIINPKFEEVKHRPIEVRVTELTEAEQQEVVNLDNDMRLEKVAATCMIGKVDKAKFAELIVAYNNDVIKDMTTKPDPNLVKKILVPRVKAFFS